MQRTILALLMLIPVVALAEHSKAAPSGTWRSSPVNGKPPKIAIEFYDDSTCIVISGDTERRAAEMSVTTTNKAHVFLLKYKSAQKNDGETAFTFELKSAGVAVLTDLKGESIRMIPGDLD